MDNGQWTVDCGLWTVDYGLWTVDYGLWTVDYNGIMERKGEIWHGITGRLLRGSGRINSH